ncbi:hypothetical protein ES708_26590 [subsurface metagenome]
MRVTAPVTDYIRASTMNTRGDLVVRGALVPERLPAGADGHYFQGTGAGNKPGYTQDMPPLITRGDLLVMGASIPARITAPVAGLVLTSLGVGDFPQYKSLFNLLTTQGDLWIRGGVVPQRLAAGALDTYFKAQGAGNLPIYEKLALRDTGVAVITSVWNEGSTPVYITPGYRISMVIILAVDEIETNLNISIGVATAHFNGCIIIRQDGVSSVRYIDHSVRIQRDGANYQTGALTNIGDTNFTMTRSSGGLIGTKLIWICLP